MDKQEKKDIMEETEIRQLRGTCDSDKRGGTRKRRIRKFGKLLMLTLMIVSAVAMVPQDTYAATRSMNVNEWLASCKAVTNRIADNKGIYSKIGCPTAYFEKKFYRKKLGKRTRLHCADYVSWCLQKYGVISSGKRFWVRGQSIKGKSAKYIKKSTKIQRIYIAKKGVLASELVKATGTKSLKKGDIISVVKSNGKGNHIMIYAGIVNGKMTYYQVSKVTTKSGKNGSTLVRTKMQTMTKGPYGEPRVAMIIRIKGLKYEDYFEVATSADENGTIGETRDVAWGGSTTISITPNEGYQIGTLTVDGKTVSISKTATSYTIKNVKAKHTVSVTFEPIPGYVPETTVDPENPGGGTSESTTEGTGSGSENVEGESSGGTASSESSAEGETSGGSESGGVSGTSGTTDAGASEDSVGSGTSEGN